MMKILAIVTVLLLSGCSHTVRCYTQFETGHCSHGGESTGRLSEGDETTPAIEVCCE